MCVVLPLQIGLTLSLLLHDAIVSVFMINSIAAPSAFRAFARCPVVLYSDPSRACRV